MRRALAGLAAVACLAVAGAGAREAWRHRPAGVFALEGRAAPAPGCVLKVQLDREADDGRPVQFGDLQCPGDADAPVLRVGDAWQALPPTATGSRYGTVRRSDDNRAWVVAADTDFFRSDDGGATFQLLHLPNWGDDVEHVLEVRIDGPRLEHLFFSYEEKLNRTKRLRSAWKAPVTDLRERWLVLREAWDGTYAPSGLTQRFESDDGGRTWTRLP